jgi:AraC-like DNA-binding protein
MADSTYREAPPPPPLADLVVCTWTRTIPPGERARPVLPDGCVDVVHQLGGGLFVAGPDTGPVEVDAAGGATFVGMRFRTGYASAALGVPADAVRDARVTLEEIWGAPAAELADRLAGCTGADAATAAVNAAVLARRTRMAAPDPLVLEAVARVARPGARVAALASELHVSERQLRRRFVAAVGYGPKTLERIVRMRRVLAAAGTARDEGLATLALDAGYADQSHMTREFARLTGRTPSAYLIPR